MKNVKYEFSLQGVNNAINSYVKSKWDQLKFSELNYSKLAGFEDVHVFAQGNFTGTGEYHFIGDARPKLQDGNGGYTVSNCKMDGYALIIVDEEGVHVKSIDTPISINR